MLSTLAATSDLASCSRCGGVRSVSFRAFRERIRGRPYRQLMAFHLRRHDPEQLRTGRNAALTALPPQARVLARELSEEWSRALEDPSVWERDTAEVLDEIVDEARDGLEARGVPPADDLLFDLFETVTLDLALAAHAEPEVRETMGIGEKDFWSRYRWNVLAAAVLVYLVGVTDDPLWQLLLWAGLGAAALPPVARWVSRSFERADGRDDG